MNGTRPGGQLPSELHVLVDARTGGVVDAWEQVRTIRGAGKARGTGKGRHSGQVPVHATATDSGFTLRDPRYSGAETLNMFHRGARGEVFTSTENVWNDGAAVDAHYGAARTYDYFAQQHQWSGIDGEGQGVQSRVHFADELTSAFYSEGTVSYGDGEGNDHPFTALEIVGHEITHGVTENTASLRYSGDAGGLDESTSDIFGTLIEFAADNPAAPPRITQWASSSASTTRACGTWRTRTRTARRRTATPSKSPTWTPTMPPESVTTSSTCWRGEARARTGPTARPVTALQSRESETRTRGPSGSARLAITWGRARHTRRPRRRLSRQPRPLRSVQHGDRDRPSHMVSRGCHGRLSLCVAGLRRVACG